VEKRSCRDEVDGLKGCCQVGIDDQTRICPIGDVEGDLNQQAPTGLFGKRRFK